MYVCVRACVWYVCKHVAYLWGGASGWYLHAHVVYACVHICVLCAHVWVCILWYMCMCTRVLCGLCRVCVQECVRERERDRETDVIPLGTSVYEEHQSTEQGGVG